MPEAKEKAREHLRNALQILNGTGDPALPLTAADVAAAQSRIRIALEQLQHVMVAIGVEAMRGGVTRPRALDLLQLALEEL